MPFVQRSMLALHLSKGDEFCENLFRCPSTGMLRGCLYPQLYRPLT